MVQSKRISWPMLREVLSGGRAAMRAMALEPGVKGVG